MLTHTKEQTDASQHIVEELETQVAALTDGYKRLEKEVINRYEAAEEVCIAAERLWQTVKIGRAVGRCLLLGRQLEAHMAEVGGNAAGRKDDHRSMIRASNTLLTIRQLFAASRPDEEGEYLSRVHVINTLQIDLIMPSENRLQARAQQIVREFSMSVLTSTNASTPTAPSAPTTYAQTEDTKARTTSACLTLYLLSPTPGNDPVDFQPSLLLASLQAYLRTSLTSSLASTARALGTLPTLSRTLLEVSARCQNIVALETLLESIKPPAHPLLASTTSPPRNTIDAASTPESSTTVGPPARPSNLLQPLLLALDTSSLPSFFWRSLASGLSGRVQDIVNRGGVSARTLKSQRERVRESIRECVIRGCQQVGGMGDRVREVEGGWDREIGVMVGSVVGVLGR